MWKRRGKRSRGEVREEEPYREEERWKGDERVRMGKMRGDDVGRRRIQEREREREREREKEGEESV